PRNSRPSRCAKILNNSSSTSCPIFSDEKWGRRYCSDFLEAFEVFEGLVAAVAEVERFARGGAERAAEFGVLGITEGAGDGGHVVGAARQRDERALGGAGGRDAVLLQAPFALLGHPVGGPRRV